LIYYERPDSFAPKTSKYSIVHTNTPSELRDVMTNAIGVTGEVRKVRWLYMIGQTRVHLDHVEGLGDFIELEVVLRLDQTESEGQQIAEEIIRQLGIREEDMIDCAYVDLLRMQV
jgi:predicted adenylyl cyclase CyaB